MRSFVSSDVPSTCCGGVSDLVCFFMKRTFFCRLLLPCYQYTLPAAACCTTAVLARVSFLFFSVILVLASSLRFLRGRHFVCFFGLDYKTYLLLTTTTTSYYTSTTYYICICIFATTKFFIFNFYYCYKHIIAINILLL